MYIILSIFDRKIICHLTLNRFQFKYIIIFVLLDVARASGEFVVAAGDRAKKIDEEYHIVDKTKSATKNALQSAKKFDEKHHVGEKMSNGLKELAGKISPKKKE